MRTKRYFAGLSASTIAIAMAATPVAAQDAGTEQAQTSAGLDIAQDGELSNDEKTLIVAGTIAAVGKKVIKPTERIAKTAQMVGESGRKKAAANVRQLPTSTNSAGQNLRQTATSQRPASLRELQNRSKVAKARPANIANSDLGRVIQNGENAQAARAGAKKPSAANRGPARKVTFRDQVTGKPNPTIKATTKTVAARPTNIANADLGRVIQNGENAQAARAGAKKPSAVNRAPARKVTFRDQVTGKPNPTIKATTKPVAARPTNIVNSDLGRVIQNGENAQAARSTRIAGSADNVAELARRGDVARNTRNVAKAGQGSQRLGRQILANGGDLGNILRQGDIAQHARRIAPVNEAQVVRNVAANGGDITQLNKAGRSAQAARGRGGLKAVSTSADAAKMARTTKLAKTAKTAGTVARVGKGGRAVLAGTGVGAVAVVAEMAAVEGIKATTGVEVQDPLSTSFQYGAALFDKDVSIADVAAQRREHHRENFRNLAETLTTEGKVMDNITKYADSKNPALGDSVRMIERFDRQRRALLEEHTGIKTERRLDVVARYGSALKNDGVSGLGNVAIDRAQHHIENTKAFAKKTQETSRKIGAAARAGVGEKTGTDLRSIRETSDRYKAAAQSKNPVQAVAKVAAQRAQHHTKNAKKVACKIGNVLPWKKKNCDK